MSTLRVDTITDEAGTGAPNFPNGATGLDAFKYNAVSGATQDLNLDNGNFFDAGTLTADTTVSFSNVPTEAQWTYTVKPDAASTYDLALASYVGSFSVATKDANPLGIFFKPDGTAMYINGNTGDVVLEYSLSVPWVISTAYYVRNFSVAAQDITSTGLFFKPDGTVMYVCGFSGDAVNEYSLATAWDISTASYVRNFSVAAQALDPGGLFFKPDGTAMYMVSNSTSTVVEYNLTTAWNISTASYVRTFSVSTNEAFPTALFFKPDGTAMYVCGYGGNNVNEYSLSTAWNISTASYVRNFSVVSETQNVRGLSFKSNGTFMYIIETSSASVLEYRTSSAFSFTVPSSVENPPREALSADQQITYTFFTADGGTTVKLINEEVL